MHGVLDKKRIHRLSFRVASFLFAFVILFFALFIIGNYERFLDRTQYLIFNLLSITIVLHLASGLFYILFFIIHNDPSLFPKRRRFILLTVTLIFSLFLFLLLQLFGVWFAF
jgi:uncharacterized membrane protein